MQMIGLLDCNNFFVSCERLFRPDLAEKAVVVLSGNDGCIVARSNEVKTAKVPMGAPYFQVKADLKALDTTLFSSNFTLYRDISARVMKILTETVGQVEQYSVDEAFFKVSGDSTADIEAYLMQVKTEIQRQVGVPVSVGAAKTKTIAKYASEKAKKGKGVSCLEGDMWQQEQSEILIERVWGIGAQVAARLRAQGINTVADLVRAERVLIERIFGVSGVRLFDELSEIPVHRFGERSKDTQKSIMSTRSFKQVTHEQSAVDDALAYHVTHAMEQLRAAGLRVGAVTVIARPSRHSDWAMRKGSAEVIFDEPTVDTRKVLAAVKESFSNWYDPEVPYKKAGIVLQRLTENSHIQANLFSDTTLNDDAAELMSLLDTVNDKYGTGSLTLGRSQKQVVWDRSKEYLSPHYTTKWSDIPTVR